MPNVKKEASRAAALKQKVDAYIAGMESKSVNFNREPTDRLLIIEALNDWSAGVLGKGESVHFTYGGADPTCATASEQHALIRRLYEHPALLYPVTGFVLSTNGECLDHQPLKASYRLMAHSDGSRASAINVAKFKHVSDVEACHQLWLLSATEDCMAYLGHRMGIYSLNFEEESAAATRRIISTFLQDQFSPGQIWNAIWRTVENAAALSGRRYFNKAKAAKTIPKQIDKVLTESLKGTPLQPYRRIADIPIGAVLTLLGKKFAIDDGMPGMRVREALAADAALAPTQTGTSNEGNTRGHYAPERTLLRGTLYFSREYTRLDRIALSCIDGIRLDPASPNWDNVGEIGHMDFTAPDLYTFKGFEFFQRVLQLLNIDPPGDAEVSQRALSFPGDKWQALNTAYEALASEVLIAAGVTPLAAEKICSAIICPIEPHELVAILRGVPLASGLTAIRLKYVSINDNDSVNADVIAAGNYTFDFPEVGFEPEHNDRDIVASVIAGDAERLAMMLATSSACAIHSDSDVNKAALLERVGRNLLDISRTILVPDSAKRP